MKRTVLIAAVVVVPLIATPALSARATEATTDTLTGVVTEVVRESGDEPHAATGHARDHDHHQVLATATGYVPLSDDGPHLTPGERVTVEVVPDGDDVEVVDILASSADADTARSASGAAAIDREVYVAIVSPAGQTLAQNTNTAASVQRNIQKASRYWSSQTAGVIDFSYGGAIAPYVSAHACGDTEKMWTEATRRFSDVGIDVTGVGKYLLVVGPSGSWEHDGCDYGLGTLGALDAPRNAVFVSDTSQSLYAHELGHNLGLAHANALRCNGVQDGVWDGAGFGGECQRWRYEDLLDVMGYSGETYGEGNLNVAHLDDLDLDPTAIRTVAGPATVTVPPLSSSAAGRGLRVTDTNGVTYYVEYRTATGADAVAVTNPYKPSLGVLLYREDPSAYRSHGSYHLDATPNRSDDFDYDRALRPGATFTTATGTLTIATVSQDATGAVLEIDGGAPSTQPDPPVDRVPATVTLTGPSKVRRNGTVTLTATVLNVAGVVVPDSKVIFQRRVDRAWRTVATSRTSTTGVARATVRMRRSATFRVATSAPVTYSSSADVKVRRSSKRR